MENLQVLKLNDTNYQLWSHQVKLIIKAKKAWHTIEQDRPKGAANNATAEEKALKAKEIEEYEGKSALAASILLSTIEPNQAQQVLNLDEAKDIWNKLKQSHEGKRSSRRVDLRLELSTIKKKENETLERYLARSQFVKDQLIQCGATVENEEYFGLVLNGLPKDYNMIRLQMKASGLDKISYDEFISGLKVQKNEIEIEEAETMLEAACISKTNKPTSVPKGDNRNNNQCYICGKNNHYARDCYFRSNSSRNPSVLLKVDNQAAIQLCTNNVYHARTKHIQRKYFFLRDEIQRHKISLKYTESRSMLADFLTKPVTKTILENCRNYLGIVEWNHIIHTNQRLKVTNDNCFQKFFDLCKKQPAINFGKLIEKRGDIFTTPEDYSLAHCVAEDFAMGSGIAKTFKEIFGRVEELRNQKQYTGGVAFLKDKNRYIYYLITKKQSREKPTYYSLWTTLNKLKGHIQEHNITKLAIPKIGCGLDNLNWDIVRQMIEYVFKTMNIKIYVYY